MTLQQSNTTRLFCASAFLRGAKFWQPVLEYLESENHGVSPDLGVDMGTVAHVCQYARLRERRYENYLFIALVAALIVSIISPAAAIALFLTATVGISFQKRYQERTRLVSRFGKKEFSQFNSEREFRSELSPTALSALPVEEQNLIVYTGFSPFVGAGANLGGWSFTVDVSKPPENQGGAVEPVPFNIKELYAVLTVKLLGLTLDGLVVKDFFFVNGREIREDREILPDIHGRPIQRLPSHRVTEYMNGNDNRIRHYKWIRVHGWEQELVMSYFLRVAVQGKNMFVENSRFLLPPIRDEYRKIDELPRLNALGTLRLFAFAIAVGPVKAALTPIVLVARVKEWLERLWKERKRLRTIRESVSFDYGAGQGHRQAFSIDQYKHYFQKADGAFYTQVLEKAVLDNIIAFLEKHRVDTSDLRERQTIIMNSGIVVQGGNVNAESLAVGWGAVASKHSSSPKSKN